MRVATILVNAWALQRPAAFHWLPVAMGAGVAWYFAIWSEPEPVLLGGVAIVLGLVWLVLRPLRGTVLLALMVVVGLGAGALRANLVAAPVLGFRYYGPVQGRIVAIDRSASDAVRLTLDRVVLDRIGPDRTPARVRISLHGEQRWLDPQPHTTIITTAHLSPPNGPVEPGGFDFRRSAWFDRLGAVGYTRTPVLRLMPPDGGGQVFRLRMAMSAALQSEVPGQAGALAAALFTGDRSGLSAESVEAMRDSNLAHLVSISGLHMGLLCGLVFSVLRAVMALVPRVALYWPAKKIAAVIAAGAGAFYLVLSGNEVATQRAFIMVCVMFLAVVLDRRAISLRSVAVAALLILLFRPEELAGPGFQMSFAATAALVVVFRAVGPEQMHRLPAVTRPLAMTLLSSLAAGWATAPFSAIHFNQMAHFGLIANLLTVPLVGAVVMPAGIAALFLWPFGLQVLALKPLQWGLDWTLWVAAKIAAMDAAVSYVPAPPDMVLPLVGIGLCVLFLGVGWLRVVAHVPFAIAIALWVQVERPYILVGQDGGLVGVMTDNGRAVNRVTGSGFVAENWLLNDGAPVPQEQSAANFTEIPFVQIVRGKKQAALAECTADIIVSNVDLPDLPCTVLDPVHLRETGAVSISRSGEITTANEIAGRRLWVQ